MIIDGDIATLRLGNEDGTLASTTTFQRVDGRYRWLMVTKCTNDPTADSSSVPLVVEGLEATEPGLRAQDVAPTATLVADRLTYDVVGLVKRITVYDYPCARRLCLEAGSNPGSRLTSSLPGSGAPADGTGLLSDPDDVMGIEPAELLVALYDTTGDLVEVSWSDKAGVQTEAKAAAAGEWSGQLFLVLAPPRVLLPSTSCSGTPPRPATRPRTCATEPRTNEASVHGLPGWTQPGAAAYP